MASNSHNMQPWKVKLDADPLSFLLFTDGERLNAQVDSVARQTTGTDAASSSAETASDAASGAPAAADAGAGPLYDCLFLPDTNRSAYEDLPLTADQAKALTESLSTYPVDVILLQGAEERRHIGDLTIEAAEVEGAVIRISEESGALFRSTEYQKNKHRYGFSVEGQGTSGFGKWLMQGLLAIAPSLAAAGMAYAQLQLTAQSMALAVQPLSQVLEEYPEMEALRTRAHAGYAPAGETIQMLVRVGRPTKDVPRSTRRDAADLVME